MDEESSGKGSRIRKAFFGRDLDTADPAFSHRPRWNTSSAVFRLCSPDFVSAADGFDPAAELVSILPEGYSGWDWLSKAQWLEYRTLLSGYILSAQGDRMLMANSVEGRFPFLDCRLVDFANSLPPEFKLNGLNEKFILKEAFRDLLPEPILERPKQPYRAPDALSFFGSVEPDWVNEVTCAEAVRDAGVFEPAAVEVLKSKCRARKGAGMSNTDNMMITAVLSTMLVFRDLVVRPESGAGAVLPDSITVVDRV